VIALITGMDQPLGRAAGNAVEVAESVECLKGKGPDDLMGLSIELAAEMVVLGERSRSLGEARELCRQVIADGRALERFRQMIECQGGDPRVVDDSSLLPAAHRRIEVRAPRGGNVKRVSARPIGHATTLLGAGRARVDSAIDPAVGLLLHKKTGDSVDFGEPLCTLLVNDESRLSEIVALISGAYGITDEPVSTASLIVDRLSG